MYTLRITTKDNRLIIRKKTAKIKVGASVKRGLKGKDGEQGPPGNDGVLQSVVAGDNITIDNTDPANPVIASTGGGGGSSQLIASTSIVPAYGGYDNDSSGGNVSYDRGRLVLDTGTGSNYTAAKIKANANFVWWDLDYSCRMSWAQLSIADGASIILGIGQPIWSGNTFAPARGIWLIAKKISSTVVTYTLLSKDGTITGTQDVTGTWVDGLSLSFDKRGSEINYYANGVLLGTNTTGIPTSATYFSSSNHVQIYAALTTGATASQSRYYLYDATTDFYAPSA